MLIGLRNIGIGPVTYHTRKARHTNNTSQG